MPHPKQNTVIQTATGNDEQCMIGINNSCFQNRVGGTYFLSRTDVQLIHNYFFFYHLRLDLVKQAMTKLEEEARSKL